MTTLPFPIFLLAPPRSFTTLVNGMLGQHPQIYGVPELTIFFRPTLQHLWRQGRNNAGTDPRLRHGILRAVAQIYFGEQTDEAIQAAEHWCAARQTLPIAEVFDELRAKVAPLHIAEKSPDYTMRLDVMLAMYRACPDARFIFLTRHPIGQCRSTLAINDGIYPFNCNSVDTRTGEPVVDPQIAWHDQNVNTLNFLENYVPKEQYIRIRGEDLLSSPEEELGALCRWLGLRDDDEAIAEMTHPERSPYACFGPITALFGNDPNFLRNPFFTRQKKKALPPLDSPLEWRSDGQGLYPEVVELAKEFGY